MPGASALAGAALLASTTLAFLYYSFWVLVLPFVDADQPVHALFPPRHLAVALPALGGTLALAALAAFAGACLASGEKAPFSSRGLLGVSAAALALLAVLLAALRATPELANFRAASPLPFFGVPVPRSSFQPVPGLPKLFVLDLPYYITPFHLEIIDVYATQLTPGGWAIFDAGGDDTPLQSTDAYLLGHATALLTALNKLVGPNGTLSAVLLSHVHGDHVGALPLLLKAYPNATVVFHEAEEPYIVGGKRWSPTWTQPGGGSVGLRAAQALWTLPPRQVVLSASAKRVVLRGASGAVPGAAGMTFHHTPGHSPGHVMYALPHLGKCIIGGDIADVMVNTPFLSSLPDGRPMVPNVSVAYTLVGLEEADRATADVSLCRAAHDRSIAYEWMLPYHNAHKRPLTRSEFAKMANEATKGCPGITHRKG